MNSISKDFRLFAKDKCGVSTSVFDDVTKSVNNSLTPVVLEERELRTTAVDVFSRLLYDRQIFFGHEVTTEACNIVVAELLYLDSLNSNDIVLMINSPGGSVTDGLSVIDTMNFISSDVSTTCLGMAASMGSVLLASGTKGKRFALPHSRIMIHQVSSATQGTLSDMKIALAEAERCKKDIYEILSNTTGKSLEEIEQLCDRDNWFHGAEALELGIIDNIITKKS